MSVVCIVGHLLTFEQNLPEKAVKYFLEKNREVVIVDNFPCEIIEYTHTWISITYLSSNEGIRLVMLFKRLAKDMISLYLVS